MRAAVSFSLTSLLLCLGGVRTAPLITSPWGQILGADGTSRSGRPYSRYLAIPYALPPVGERRFAKPVSHPGPGVGRVFNASTPGYICPQKSTVEEDRKVMSEDCLTLNVYVPSSAGAGPRSVMLWIHGGGFIQGSALQYVPSELVTVNDVIVVVIQYRLDVLGFLASGDDVIPGNFGLWDQALAVQWVSNNIRAFGGDPDSLTLFGESAGASGVGYQMITPVLKGVDFRVILQSGTPLAFGAFGEREDAEQVFRELARNTGCLAARSWADSVCSAFSWGRQRADSERVLDCLRGQEVATLLNAVQFVSGPQKTTFFGAQKLWFAVPDGQFLPRNPADLMRDVNYLADVGATSRDVMMGVNNEEGGFLLALARYLRTLYADAEFQEIMKGLTLDGSLARALLTEELLFLYRQELSKDPSRLETLVNVLEFFYTQPLNGGEVPEQSVLDVLSDTFFVVPTAQFLADLTEASDRLRTLGRPSGGRRYLYLFNHYPPSRAGLSRGRGLYHGEDLFYEFDFNDYFGAGYTSSADDLALGSTFRSMISSFAKTGIPQLAQGQQAGIVWPEFTLADQQYLSLEVVPRVDSYLFSERVALWLDLVPSLMNSTQGINKFSWTMPWQQQQQQQMYYPSSHGTYSMMQQSPMKFFFKGRMSFFKLH